MLSIFYMSSGLSTPIIVLVIILVGLSRRIRVLAVFLGVTLDSIRIPQTLMPILRAGQTDWFLAVTSCLALSAGSTSM